MGRKRSLVSGQAEPLTPSASARLSIQDLRPSGLGRQCYRNIDTHRRHFGPSAGAADAVLQTPIGHLIGHDHCIHLLAA